MGENFYDTRKDPPTAQTYNPLIRFFAVLKDGLTCFQIKYKDLVSTICEYKIQGHLQMDKFRGFAKPLERWHAMCEKKSNYILSSQNFIFLSIVLSEIFWFFGLPDRIKQPNNH